MSSGSGSQPGGVTICPMKKCDAGVVGAPNEERLGIRVTGERTCNLSARVRQRNRGLRPVSIREDAGLHPLHVSHDRGDQHVGAILHIPGDEQF